MSNKSLSFRIIRIKGTSIMAQQIQSIDDMDPGLVQAIGWCLAPTNNLNDEKPLKYLRITGLPKKINARTLTSMIVTATMIGPRSVQICCLTDDLNGPKVGYVEYKNSVDAHRAAERFRVNPCARKLIVNITTEPKFHNPNDVEQQ